MAKKTEAPDTTAKKTKEEIKTENEAKSKARKDFEADLITAATKGEIIKGDKGVAIDKLAELQSLIASYRVVINTAREQGIALKNTGGKGGVFGKLFRFFSMKGIRPLPAKFAETPELKNLETAIDAVIKALDGAAGKLNVAEDQLKSVSLQLVKAAEDFQIAQKAKSKVSSDADQAA